MCQHYPDIFSFLVSVASAVSLHRHTSAPFSVLFLPFRSVVAVLAFGFCFCLCLLVVCSAVLPLLRRVTTKRRTNSNGGPHGVCACIYVSAFELKVFVSV